MAKYEFYKTYGTEFTLNVQFKNFKGYSSSYFSTRVCSIHWPFPESKEPPSNFATQEIRFSKTTMK